MHYGESNMGGALTKDSTTGKTCGAKIAYMLTLAVCLFKILVGGTVYNGVVVETPDYSGMALFIAPIAAAYWGRSNTKAKQEAGSV